MISLEPNAAAPVPLLFGRLLLFVEVSVLRFIMNKYRGSLAWNCRQDNKGRRRYLVLSSAPLEGTGGVERLLTRSSGWKILERRSRLWFQIQVQGSSRMGSSVGR